MVDYECLKNSLDILNKEREERKERGEDLQEIDQQIEYISDQYYGVGEDA